MLEGEQRISYFLGGRVENKLFVAELFELFKYEYIFDRVWL